MSIQSWVDVIVSLSREIQPETMPSNLDVKLMTLWKTARSGNHSQRRTRELSKNVACLTKKKWRIFDVMGFLDFCYNGKILSCSEDSDGDTRFIDERLQFDVCRQCDEGYNNKERTPMNFLCGCTICKTCMLQMNGDFYCNVCKMSSDVAVLPVNSFALSYIEDRDRVLAKRSKCTSNNRNGSDCSEDDGDTPQKRARTNAIERCSSDDIVELYERERDASNAVVAKIEQQLQATVSHRESLIKLIDNHYDSAEKALRREHSERRNQIDEWGDSVHLKLANCIEPLRRNISVIERVLEESGDDNDDDSFRENDLDSLRENLSTFASMRRKSEPTFRSLNIHCSTLDFSTTKFYGTINDDDFLEFSVPKDLLEIPGDLREFAFNFKHADAGDVLFSVFPAVGLTYVNFVFEVIHHSELDAFWHQNFQLKLFRDNKFLQVNRKEAFRLSTRKLVYESRSGFYPVDISANDGANFVFYLRLNCNNS
ncbi:MAG: hypothetical protein BVN35_05915 [Proteobacteria bacterium ST_bin11]|nr:MAG: hypothetical protein BVN35_05915 [Proteobacteria bacterium ST_bin11]